MKYNFNDSNIVTCYIKELLYNFNLPMIPVFTTGTVPYEGRRYINNNDIAIYQNGKLNKINGFYYNKKIVNLTKNLNMRSSIYDIYTHNYLGEYLRFIKDYNKINLMPLYNCFGNNQLSKVDYSIEGFDFIIDSNDQNYLYYLIPVRFNHEYTIALTCSKKYELSCVYYYNNGIEDKSESLIRESYKVVHGSNFKQPYIYSTSFSSADWKKEVELNLILKLPREAETSITILEGNYLFESVDGRIQQEYIGEGGCFNLSKLSLLEVNNKKSYPFSDRLVEYLMDNVISSYNPIDTNVMMVQDLAYSGIIKGIYGNWDKLLMEKLYKISFEQDYTKGSNKRYGNEVIRSIVNNGSVTDISNSEDQLTEIRYIDSYSDTLYYADKDLEYMLNVRK